MSNDFITTIKNLFGTLSSSAAGSEEYEKSKKELEEFLKNSADSVLPEKQTLPDVPGYERMGYDATSDSELEKTAKDSLASYENETKSAIESEIEALQKKYETDKTSSGKSAEEKKQETSAAYENARELTGNDSLKRGLARSSIAVNKQAELNAMEAKDITKIVNGLNEKILLLDEEISSLSVKREKALNDFNIAYATKLTALINDLKDERGKKNEEALKYNNTLTEKEYSQNTDKVMKESDLYTEALSQKEKEEKLKENDSAYYESVYSKMRSLLNTLSADEAKKAVLNDSFYKDSLPAEYYYKLYNEFSR